MQKSGIRKERKGRLKGGEEKMGEVEEANPWERRKRRRVCENRYGRKELMRRRGHRKGRKRERMQEWTVWKD